MTNSCDIIKVVRLDIKDIICSLENTALLHNEYAI